MKYVKMFGLAALAAALMAFAAVGTASATTLDDSEGAMTVGESITAAAEGTTELHPPIGSINCKASHVGGKITNAGGAGVNVSGSIEGLSFTECNAKVVVLANGSLSIASSGGSNGTLFGTGNEVTVEYLGFHCIFKTNNTSLGTLTGSTTTGGAATLDISANIPRTGGRSGAFCGTAAAWTGSYAVSTPNPLNVTG
jgi:hypothetical protein